MHDLERPLVLCRIMAAARRESSTCQPSAAGREQPRAYGHGAVVCGFRALMQVCEQPRLVLLLAQDVPAPPRVTPTDGVGSMFQAPIFCRESWTVAARGRRLCIPRLVMAFRGIAPDGIRWIVLRDDVVDGILTVLLRVQIYRLALHGE
jgi:hypothetical protein